MQGLAMQGLAMAAAVGLLMALAAAVVGLLPPRLAMQGQGLAAAVGLLMALGLTGRVAGMAVAARGAGPGRCGQTG